MEAGDLVTVEGVDDVFMYVSDFDREGLPHRDAPARYYSLEDFWSKPDFYFQHPDPRLRHWARVVYHRKHVGRKGDGPVAWLQRIGYEAEGLRESRLFVTADYDQLKGA